MKMRRLLAFVLALAVCLALNGSAFAANNYNLNGRNVLQPGASGSGVRDLQNALIDLGYLSKGSADGSYGTKTETAVKAFQSKNGFSGQIGFAGVATMFTQAVLFGNNAVSYYSRYSAPNNSTGEYGIRNCRLNYTTRLESSFEFINYDYHNVNAICVYYWLEDPSERPVTMDGNDYWMQWYYNMDVEENKSFTVECSFDATSRELGKANTLRFLVGEIAYDNGAVNVTFNASKPPQESPRYLLGSW